MIEVGELLDGRYRLDSILGSGATASVYRAKDERRGVWRAIKILHQNMAFMKRCGRFEQEARLLVGLRHRNIVRVHATGSSQEGTYIVMDLVTGGTLKNNLQNEGKMEPRLATSVLQQMLQGLHHAHEQGVVHRDLQPGTSWWRRTSTPRLVDFGIAVPMTMKKSPAEAEWEHGVSWPQNNFTKRAWLWIIEQIFTVLAPRCWPCSQGRVRKRSMPSKPMGRNWKLYPKGWVKDSAGDPISSRRPCQTAAEMGRALADAHSKLHAQRPQEERPLLLGTKTKIGPCWSRDVIFPIWKTLNQVHPCLTRLKWFKRRRSHSPMAESPGWFRATGQPVFGGLAIGRRGLMLMLLATAALGRPMGLMTNRYSPVSSENRPGHFLDRICPVA